MHGANNFWQVDYEEGSLEHRAELLAELMFWLDYDAMGPCDGCWNLEDEQETRQYMGMDTLYTKWISDLSFAQKEIVFQIARQRYDEQP